MKEIGHTRLKYKGEIVDVAVNDNGTITLPNGKKMKLPDEKYKALCTQIEQERMQAEASTQASQMDIYAANSTPLDAFQAYDDTAERKYRRKRRIKIFFGIIAALAVIAASFFFVYQRYPEFLGLAPNSYKVVVANTDIPAGATIEDSNLSYIDLSRDEYAAQCTDMYMADDGSMKTDRPVFFVNANNKVVGRFADVDITNGTIIKESMVTNKKFAGEVIVDGEKQQLDATATQLSGEMNVEIIARVKTADGGVQEFPLSTMKLKGKTVEELLDSAGKNLLNSATADDSQPSNVTVSEEEGQRNE